MWLNLTYLASWGAINLAGDFRMLVSHTVTVNKFSFYCYFDCISIQLYHSYVDCILQFLASVSVSLEWLLALSTSPIQHPDRMLILICITLCRLWAGETGQTWSGCGPQKYPGESGDTWLYPCEERWCVLSIADESMVCCECQYFLAVFQVVVWGLLAVLVVTLLTLPWAQGGCRPQWGQSSPATSTRCEMNDYMSLSLRPWIIVSHVGNKPKTRLTLFTRVFVSGNAHGLGTRLIITWVLCTLSLLCSHDLLFWSHVHVVCVSFLSLPIVFTNFCFAVFYSPIMLLWSTRCDQILKCI